MKKNDWPVVYQHVKHREEQGKEWAVYLRNYRIEKKKAWKEMRRNGALSCSPRQGTVTISLPTQRLVEHILMKNITDSPSPLPYGVSVRTPSPVLSSRRTITPPADFTQRIFHPTAAVSNYNTAQGFQVVSADLQSIFRKDSTLRKRVETVPFIQLMRNLISK